MARVAHWINSFCFVAAKARPPEMDSWGDHGRLAYLMNGQRLIISSG